MTPELDIDGAGLCSRSIRLPVDALNCTPPAAGLTPMPLWRTVSRWPTEFAATVGLSAGRRSQ